MSDVLDTAAAPSDDDLERRLRTTYAALASSTRLERTTLDVTPTPTWTRQPLRLAVVAAAVVLLVGLGVIATQRRDDGAAGTDAGPRWAVVQLYQWGFLEVRPYDAELDGLGSQRGDVLRYGRGDAELSVMSLRNATIDDDRLVEDADPGAPSVLVTPDGRLAVRRMSGDLTLVLQTTGDTDAGHTPDLVQLARSVVTVGEDTWFRAQQRQGFALLGLDSLEPRMVVELGNGVELERTVSGSLRSGVSALYRTSVISTFGAPALDEVPRVDVYGAADRPIVLRASPSVTAVSIDGADVALTFVTDPDSGVSVGWAAVRLEVGTRQVVGRDATGAVVFESRVPVRSTDGGDQP